ncbi:MAG TPA: Lrp/AsnC family transcriptional regulator [Ideonella sp.]|uniref:Lrp/AsnC family transcriptional regulator n=1 Tax=Ideonella sp. TaxID=1929293 RepID=UPI002E36EA09|nr:Lrp/AsnC family transcriptional regulator [Ideonella sp.]HEX5686421.1 Lrp/AsnC family transcriptional regulator [Ideonella sp.]
MPVPLDDTDRTLISLLRDNARHSIATLASKTGVSRGTVQNRLARLEREGVIAGYTLVLGGAAADAAPPVRALMTIAVDGNRAPEVLRALRGQPSVRALHKTNGRWGIVAELQAESLDAFNTALGSIRLIDGILQSETSLLLASERFYCSV